MLFNPVYFKGFDCPGCAPLVPLLPRKIQQIPGVMHGGRRLAGDHPLARRQDGVDLGRQGNRQAGQPVRVLQAARPRTSRGAHPRHRARRHARGGRADHGARAPGPLARPAATRSRGRPRPRPGAAAGHRPRGHRRDRPPHRPDPRHQADGDPLLRREPRDGQPDLPGDRPQGAQVHHQLRLLLRLPARHPGRVHHERGALLVGAADPRRAGRLHHQPRRDLHDLPADRAAELPRREAPGPVHEAPARGRGRLRADRRRRHREPQQHRRGAPQRTPRGPHAKADRVSDGAPRSTVPSGR